MEYVLIIAVVAIAGYLAIAYKFRRWPFKAKVVGVVRSREQAIIDTLVCKAGGNAGTLPVIYSQTLLELAIDDGITAAFAERTAKAKTLGWTKGFEPSDYTIYVFPSVSDFDDQGTYSPTFKVFIDKDSPYWGSQWDAGGYILAAERVLMNTGDEPTNTFIIAANNSKEYTQTATANGLDHILAFKNDRDLYERTKDHSQTGGHPLW